MSSEPDGPPDDAADTAQGLDRDELYQVIRRAVEDAILGVLGTLLLVGVGFVMVWVGTTTALSATGPVIVALGVGVVGFGLALAAAALGLLPVDLF